MGTRSDQEQARDLLHKSSLEHHSNLSLRRPYSISSQLSQVEESPTVELRNTIGSWRLGLPSSE